MRSTGGAGRSAGCETAGAADLPTGVTRREHRSGGWSKGRTRATGDTDLLVRADCRQRQGLRHGGRCGGILDANAAENDGSRSVTTIPIDSGVADIKASTVEEDAPSCVVAHTCVVEAQDGAASSRDAGRAAGNGQSADVQVTSNHLKRGGRACPSQSPSALPDNGHLWGSGKRPGDAARDGATDDD